MNTIREAVRLYRVSEKSVFFVSQNTFFTMIGGFSGGVKSAEKTETGFLSGENRKKSNIKIYK